MICAEILQLLASRPDPHAVAGMARFGIVAKKVHGGWTIPALKKLAREIGHHHTLAQELWASEIFEARVLATLIDEPARVTKRQMNHWAKDFDNWAICDGACINLFRYTKFAHQMCVEWAAARVRQKGGICPDGGTDRGRQGCQRRDISPVPAADQKCGDG
jgi:3-methyladenine DNA glycosylase AlkD